MQIQISDSQQFHRLLSALADELVEAEVHFKLYKDLTAAIPEYLVEVNQSRTFWSLTLTAQLDAVVHRLCRAYDQYDSGNPPVNLRNLLDTIDANQHLFDEPNFRERLKGNPFVDSLAATPRRPDSAQLQKNHADPLVKKIVIQRNNLYAHLSSAHALDAKAFAEKYPISLPDIEALLANGITIVNRYSDLFIATRHSTNIVGRDDYRRVLEAVREAIAAHEARIEEQIKELQLKH
jgi:hypothetical protein